MLSCPPKNIAKALKKISLTKNLYVTDQANGQKRAAEDDNRLSWMKYLSEKDMYCFEIFIELTDKK